MDWDKLEESRETTDATVNRDFKREKNNFPACDRDPNKEDERAKNDMEQMRRLMEKMREGEADGQGKGKGKRGERLLALFLRECGYEARRTAQDGRNADCDHIGLQKAGLGRAVEYQRRKQRLMEAVG